MHFISRTHRGRVARNNEDRLLIRKLGDGSSALLVADGLGGQPGGDVAAGLVVGHIEAQPPERLLRGTLQDLLIESSYAILRHGERHPQIDGMGSTATLAVVDQHAVHWAHVGDCRLYLFSGGVLHCQTRDQTLARQAYDRGEISFSEIRVHPHNHVLEQCLGEEDVEPDYGEFTWNRDDVMLICSDGLHTMIDDNRIRSILSSPASLDERADRLLESALAAGGKDNISLILGCHAPVPVNSRP